MTLLISFKPLVHKSFSIWFNKLVIDMWAFFKVFSVSNLTVLVYNQPISLQNFLLLGIDNVYQILLKSFIAIFLKSGWHFVIQTAHQNTLKLEDSLFNIHFYIHWFQLCHGIKKLHQMVSKIFTLWHFVCGNTFK